MEDSKGSSIREAIKKYGPITDRFILRLGKSEEEAGKFESWHSTPNTFEEDLQGYLTCLSLTRLVDSVEERMKSQKGNIRAIKKEQKATAKAIAKEQEKLQKALDKAAAKVAREAEKARIKAEAKAERERLKTEKKGILCTSTSVTTTLAPQTAQSSSLGSTAPEADSSSKSQDTPVKKTQQPELIILTVEKENPSLSYETETYVPKFNIPMEG